MRRNWTGRMKGWCAAGALLATLPLQGMAETLMMPDREAEMGVDVVVWGVTDQAGNYTLRCGNGAQTGAAVTDGSYIAAICNYGAEGTYTASLEVNGETAEADVAVFDTAGLSAIDLRGLRINVAIENGLRNLWVNQVSRAANFPAGITTNWGGTFPYAHASLVVLAFENQGYSLPADGSNPTGLYQKYVVRRGLNYVLSNLSAIGLTTTPQGDDPCVAVADGPAPCTGLTTPGDPGYSIGTAMLGFAGSGALGRVNNEIAGPTMGMTYGEILQRLTNTLAWGQADANCGVARGGWVYQLNSCSFDGSTVGWAILGFLDAGAAGATIPAWVAPEFLLGMNNAINNDGSFDYRGNGNPASLSSISAEKGGIPLQGMAFTGNTTQQALVAQWISDHWDLAPTFCQVQGCAYTMFNNFKGLKLAGIQTLPGVGRPAGPGTIPANDWHEDYKDWLLANQDAPNTLGGGSWGPAMGFSCCAGNVPNSETAIAELILSPVALVLPDPIRFSEVGMRHCLDGAPCLDRDIGEDTNPVGTEHKVVATAESENGAPIPGTTIEIDILTGPNAGGSFSGVSNADGDVFFTYTSNGVAGTDEIQASIAGRIFSNTITKVWESAGGAGGRAACDIDGDTDIDRNDIRLIYRKRGEVVDPPGTAGSGDYDADGDVDTIDVKLCIKEQD